MARIADPAGHEATALSRLVDFSGKNVIDIGCGIGRTVRHIAGTAASVLGVDPNEESIARARSSAGDEADRCTFMAADALTLNLPPASLDVVIYSRSL